MQNIGEVFRVQAFEEGPDLAFPVATVGLIYGVVSGIVLVDIGIRRRRRRPLRNFPISGRLLPKNRGVPMRRRSLLPCTTRTGRKEHTMVRNLLLSIATASVLFSATSCGSPSPTPADPVTEDLRNVPIQEYDPLPMLRARVTEVPRARYPVVDFHNHLRRAGTEEEVDEIIRAMNAGNVALVVNFDGGMGETLEINLQRFDRRHPGRFVQFMTVPWDLLEEPDFIDRVVAGLQEGYEMGARGLKIHKNLGLTLRYASGELVRIDDPRLDPIWAKCGELGIPVAIHTADPAAFFTPLDRDNERLIELMDHPEWSFYGPEFPSREELHEQRNAVFARHPETVFVGLHVANNPEDLDTVSRWLDQYPNLYVETGARVSELGRQPYSARDFLIRYQDRVLFGTDTAPLPGVKSAESGEEMYRLHWRFFETHDEYFDVRKTHHLQALWRVYGLYLPDEALEKFYAGNARRLIPGLDEE